MTVFVTGGLGFIGSNFVFAHLKRHAADSIVILDNHSYAANSKNIYGLYEDYRVTIVNCDIAEEERLNYMYDTYSPTITYHFAAESHVDNSIAGDDIFVRSNIIGTHNILKCVRKFGGRLIHVSTDEVYGSLGPYESGFTEKTPYDPRNPYSATKAASDHLVRSYINTHKIQAVITNCSNNYGPRQHSEKFIPTIIRKAMANEPIPVYGTGQNVRDWLFVEDHCDAILTVAANFKAGERYNIGGGYEESNYHLACLILEMMGKPKSLIEFVEDRKGHDYRYSMDYSKIKSELGWTPKTNILDGLRTTLEWYENA